jgi:hypothetical protein
MNLISFSQNATNKDTLVCIPKSIAKKIALDLTKKDLNDSIVSNLTIDNKLLLKKVNFQDSIMKFKDNQILLFTNNEKLFNQSLEYKDKEINKLTLDLDSQKKYTKFSLISGGALCILTMILFR